MGEKVFISAEVPSGQRFDHWDTNASLSFSVQQGGYTSTRPPQDITVTAKFENSSKGGTSAGYTTYRPTVDASEHGSVSVLPQNPAKGATVTIITDTEEGYEVGKITVTDATGAPVKVADNGDGTYTLIQPNGRVCITVSFQAVQSSGGYDTCPRDETCPIWPFTDASTTAWYHDGIHYCAEQGLIVGTSANKFSPELDISRAMPATILWWMEDSPAMDDGKSGTFIDVPDNTWYTEAVEWAAGAGVVKGYGSRSIRPRRPHHS